MQKSVTQLRAAPVQHKRLFTGKGLLRTEDIFNNAMWLRSRLLLPSVRALPDYSAKEEVIEAACSNAEHPAVIAYRDNSLGFGFSAGGLLFPYFVGVVKALHERHIISPGTTRLAGSSAGSLICACYNAGVPPEVITELFLDLADELRSGGAYRRMGPCLEKVLEEHLPDDAHERCSGNTFIGITAALPYAKSELISTFESKADLIQCLLTSCHIPIYFAGTMTRSFRGRMCYDGGVTNFIPVPPPLTPSSYSARVCCFPSRTMNRLYNIHIAPDTFDDTWAKVTMTEVLKWALSPSTVDVYDQMFEKGELDASAWAHLTGVTAAACPDPDDWYRHAFLQEEEKSMKEVSENAVRELEEKSENSPLKDVSEAAVRALEDKSS